MKLRDLNGDFSNISLLHWGFMSALNGNHASSKKNLFCLHPLPPGTEIVTGIVYTRVYCSLTRLCRRGIFLTKLSTTPFP
jgi:hypothetical protein